MSDLERAKALLQEGGYTCVFVMQTGVFTSKERGVKPLLDVLNKDMGTLNACVADKVVGKAAAFLYTLMNIAKLYAATVSEPALEVLKEAEIEVQFDHLVPSIKNRANTGQCPMESAVWEVTDAQFAREILEEESKK